MIRRATVNDIGSIIKLLPKKVVDNKTKNILKQHMRDGIVFVLEDERGIVGVSAIMCYENQSAWTYYYIDDRYRGKQASLKLFLMSMSIMSGTQILIKSKELADKSTFNTYIKPYKNSTTIFEFEIPKEKLEELEELTKEIVNEEDNE